MRPYIALMGLFLTSAATADDCLLQQTHFLARLQALALMETLNADLLASRSATLTLDQWCADHHIAADAKIHAQRVKAPDKPITPEQRERLHIGPDEPVKYRRVALTCGTHVLSEADNWYVAGRLTPEMNQQLEETDIPFGRVVQPLHPTRETFVTLLHYQPLSKGWELQPAPTEADAKPIELPEHLFEHRALLFNASHEPFSEVHEVYTRAVLEFPRDTPPR
jgi:chorismate-pyruvate lyase